MTKRPTVAPVDLLSVRGLTSHAESHWLTFATALKCYATNPHRSALKKAANRHGPQWLRSALHAESTQTIRPKIRRPKELEPLTGSLAFLTEGAEDALKSTEALPDNSCSSPRVGPTLKKGDVESKNARARASQVTNNREVDAPCE